MIHELKILPEYFEAVGTGEKPFEVRKNDRGYRVGDYLALNEYDGNRYTGRSILAKITYILTDGKYCKEGYAVMGIKVCVVNVLASVPVDGNFSHII